MEHNIHLVKVLIFILGARITAASRGHRVSPTLSPASDKEFFGKDFPHDGNPRAGNLNFDHPFPKVQKSSTFDNDFVKDENNDGGVWAAQSEYDKLRKKLQVEEADVKPAKKAMEQAVKELDDAKQAEAAARQKYDEAEANERAAQKEEANAIEQEQKAESRAKAAEKKTEDASSPVDMPTSDDVGKAKTLVEDRIKHLEDCQAQLAKAREALKVATARKAELQQDESAKREEHLQDAKTTQDSAAKANTEKALEVAKMTAEEAQLAKAEREHDVAKKDYEKEMEEVQQTEKELREVEERLKNLRHGTKSGSSAVAHPVLVTVGAVTLAILAT
eukprot:TRINITY_DN487_c0_g3_i1.p1 TRINITY_DN487_c0_g3~~TRINITY_DN487_c0_g3_i1.p1  ORF type:complete len:354 (-),score=101.05 TRINITY_DN487_c0_g3_i1:80-1078(-)